MSAIYCTHCKKGRVMMEADGSLACVSCGRPLILPSMAASEPIPDADDLPYPLGSRSKMGKVWYDESP